MNPPSLITDDPKAGQGYMGHDEFALVETSLARRFLIYIADDASASPSGKARQLEYSSLPMKRAGSFCSRW